MGSKALVTLVVGEQYASQFRKFSLATWERYAERWGYDLHVFDQPLDTTDRARSRSPAWQKCLVFEQPLVQSYEQVVWLDSDVMINAESARCIVSEVPPDMVGAVDCYSNPSANSHRAVRERFGEHVARIGSQVVPDTTSESYYTNYGLPSGGDGVVQTGVLVASPRAHADIFRDVYESYEEKRGAQWHYEMRPLGYELLKAGRIHWIDHRFNRIWIEMKAYWYPYLMKRRSGRSLPASLRRRLGLRHPRHNLLRTAVTTAFLNSFFLHFAGGARRDMEYVDTSVRSVWAL